MNNERFSISTGDSRISEPSTDMILRGAYLQFTFAFSEPTLLGTVEYPEDVQYVNSGGRRDSQHVV